MDVPGLGAGEDELGRVEHLQLVGVGEVGRELVSRHRQPRPAHTHIKMLRQLSHWKSVALHCFALISSRFEIKI